MAKSGAEVIDDVRTRGEQLLLDLTLSLNVLRSWVMASLIRTFLGTVAGLAICPSGNVNAQQPPAPATWVLHGDPHRDNRLAWSTPGLQDFLNYGYVVCNADRTHAIVLRYKFNSINQKKIGPRECFGVDSPTRLDLVTDQGEALKLKGFYLTYRWGSFGMGKLEGVTFPLTEDEAIKPPVKGARVHGLSAPREESARCEKFPRTGPRRRISSPIASCRCRLHALLISACAFP